MPAWLDQVALAASGDAFVTRPIALDALRDELHGVVAGQPGQPLHQGHAQQGPRDGDQRAGLPAWCRDQVEGMTDLELDLAVGIVVEDRSEQRRKREHEIAGQVRQDPPHRPLQIIVTLVDKPEFALRHRA